jgi:hypothetical protein
MTIEAFSIVAVPLFGQHSIGGVAADRDLLPRAGCAV